MQLLPQAHLPVFSCASPLGWPSSWLLMGKRGTAAKPTRSTGRAAASSSSSLEDTAGVAAHASRKIKPKGCVMVLQEGQNGAAADGACVRCAGAAAAVAALGAGGPPAGSPTRLAPMWRSREQHDTTTGGAPAEGLPRTVFKAYGRGCSKPSAVSQCVVRVPKMVVSGELGCGRVASRPPLHATQA